MKGFILNIRKAKNEDVIVTVLSKSVTRRYYRFYGARHSILQVGNLIDFEVEDDNKRFMPRLRRVSHTPFPWIYVKNRLIIWQNFIHLFEPHLKDTNIDSFYFNLLLEKANRWSKQNPKRLAIEAYIELLTYEKRIYYNEFCYICNRVLNNNIGLMRAYIPVHPVCINSISHNKHKIFKLFSTKSTIEIDDDEIDGLFKVLLKGF